MPAFIRTLTARILILATLGSMPLSGVLRAEEEPSTEWAANFAAPPDSAKIWVYWFWNNGMINREGIHADLEAMHRVGIGGVLIMDLNAKGALPGPVRYGTPAWNDLFSYALSEAARLGMQVDMNNDSGWEGSGGPWIQPGNSMQTVVTTETSVVGPQDFRGPISKPKIKKDNLIKDYYRDIAVLAFPTPAADTNPEKRPWIDNLPAKIGAVRDFQIIKNGTPAFFPAAPADAIVARDQVIDLTSQLDADGNLNWKVPQGKWTILRVGYTPTGTRNIPGVPEAQGLECDKLSPDGIDAQFENYLSPLIAAAGPLCGKTLAYTHIDSWENRCQNWTPKMRQEFQKRRGYDPLPFLPVMTGLVVDSREISERFLWDLRKTITELTNENYAGRLAQLAHQHGLQVSIEAYGDGMTDNVSYGGRADSPMGESWGNGNYDPSLGMPSAGHTYGNKIIGVEMYTTPPSAEVKWTSYPYNLKTLADNAFYDGYNRLVICGYAMQPWLNRYPGMTCGPYGERYERTLTWWEFTRPWHDYLARCQYMLRQGLYVADLAYLQTEDSPNYPFHTPPTDSTAYRFDDLTPEVLLTRASVRDGRFELPDGMSYRLLVLPDSQTMTPLLLRKIGDLVAAGATALGSRPLKSPSLVGYPGCDAEIKQLGDEIWGDCDGKKITEHSYGKGRIICGRTPDAVLAEMGVTPDFRTEQTGEMPSLRYLHRTDNGTDIYFVSNTSQQPQQINCLFRVKDKRPEFWWPESGRIEPAAPWQKTPDGTRVPVWLDPASSVFVVFRPEKAAASPEIFALSRNGTVIVPPPFPQEKITITKAMFGEPDEPNGGKDVTAKIQHQVSQGDYAQDVTDNSNTTPRKVLRVDYTTDGQPQTIKDSILEIALLFHGDPPAAQLHGQSDGSVRLEAREPGLYSLKMASGATQEVNIPSLPPPIEMNGPWEVRFPAGWGAPEHIQLDKLGPWTDYADAGVKYFSGTGTYVKQLEIPATFFNKDHHRIYLDLGSVQVIAKVKLNGKDLGVVWKPPYEVDITEAAKTGDNTLEVAVANLWVNRMIGDEQLPEDSKRSTQPTLVPGQKTVEYPSGELLEWPQWLLDGKPSPTGRFTFTTWRLWHKDDALLPSGLIGPVVLRSTAEVVIHP